MTPATQRAQPHPLIHAGRWLVSDLLSTLVFVGLFAATHSLYAATGLAIAFGLIQIAWLKLRGSSVDAMQWMSLGLVVVFGSASLVTHDPRFVMFKPTLIYAAVGAVMLRRGWMTRYVPPIVLTWSADVTIAFGYLWAALMFATAGVNFWLAVRGDQVLWAWFLGVVPLGSKVAMIALQYLTTRAITRGRIRASRRGAPEAALATD